MDRAAWASSVLGATFLAAGLIKALSPRAFARTLRRLGPAGSADRGSTGWPQRAAWSVALCEIAVGIFLLWAPDSLRTGAAALALLMSLGFVVAVRRAIRVGASCGCFGSLSTGPAGPVETGRAIVVSALAVYVVAQPGRGAPLHALHTVPHVGAAAGALVAAVVLIVTGARSRVAGWRRPIRRVAPPSPVRGRAAEILISQARDALDTKTVEKELAARGCALDWAGATANRSGGTTIVAVSGTPRSSLMASMPAPGSQQQLLVIGYAGTDRLVASGGQLTVA